MMQDCTGRDEASYAQQAKASRLGGGISATASPAPNLAGLWVAINTLERVLGDHVTDIEKLYDTTIDKLGGPVFYDRPTSDTLEEVRDSRPERIGRMTDEVERFTVVMTKRLQILTNLFNQISNRLD